MNRAATVLPGLPVRTLPLYWSSDPFLRGQQLRQQQWSMDCELHQTTEICALVALLLRAHGMQGFEHGCTCCGTDHAELRI